MQKRKSRIRRKVHKKMYRYPRKIHILINDNIFSSCTQIREAFLRKSSIKHYLQKINKAGYLSSKGYNALINNLNKQKLCSVYKEDCSVYIVGVIRLGKNKIKRFYNSPVSLKRE